MYSEEPSYRTSFSIVHLPVDQVSAVVIGHTRWASIGIISEPNAHPLNSEQEIHDQMPYVVAAINGDVDNFADLKEMEELNISPAVTSDSKVMPTLMAQHLNKKVMVAHLLLKHSGELLDLLKGQSQLLLMPLQTLRISI